MKYLLLTLLLTTLTSSLKAEMGVIAHRGAGQRAPENTMAALKKAVQLGSPYIEIDVQLTRDGEVVLMHDKTLDRTTNGSGYVARSSYKMLKTLDAGSWFSPVFKNEKIPHLKEVLEWLPKGITLIIEVKSNGTHSGIEKKIVDLIQTKQKQDQIWVKSFDKKVLKNFETLLPTLPKVFVFVAHLKFFDLTLGTSLEWKDFFADLKELNVRYLQPHSFFLTRSFAQEMLEKGFQIIAWGVNSKRRLKQMASRGVSFIETDSPGWAKTFIQKGL